MAEFKIAHQRTAAFEGGYVNDPNDKGGETYRGISRKWFPGWEGWPFIDEYKRTHAICRGDIIPGTYLSNLVDDFYKEKFWDTNKLDFIKNQDIANELFDTGVNMGTAVAAQFLQKALNLLNNNGRDYKDLVIDGKIGPTTLTVTNTHKYPGAIVKLLNALQGSRYIEICKNEPSQEVNFRGWLKRL